MAEQFVSDIREVTPKDPSDVREEQSAEVEHEGNVNEENGVGETVVVIAGRPSSGKSRALNNIFGVEFVSKNSVSSVTEDIEYKKVTKQGSTVIVVDTPGLGAADLKMDAVEDKFASVVGDLSCTLLYCHSVGPNSKLMDVDIRIFKNLQKILGKQIWKKCIILFTFSDSLRREYYAKFHERENYLGYLQEHAEHLTKILKKHCGEHVPIVKLVTDMEVDDKAEVEYIVAVPVGREVTQRREKEFLIPGPNRSGINWVVIAWKEILRKSSELDRIVLHKVASNAQTIAGLAVSLAVGITLGGMGGAVVGAAAAGFGAIPGACAGAFIGGLTASMGTSTIGQVIIAPHVRATKKKAMAEKLRAAEFVDTSDHDVLREDLVSSTSSSSASEVTQSCPAGAALRKRQQRAERPRNRIPHQNSQPSPSPRSSPDAPFVDSEAPKD